ncbi:MAG: hypothetical protein AAGE18_11990 [Pseudomonadota bacterium]
MTTPAAVHLHILYARRATKAVILRRGPARHVRCILWDWSDDTFEDGQWFRGRIRPEHSDISADGRHFLYLAYDYGPGGASVGHAWTAISRPPWLTALALYPDASYRGGGGRFLDDRRYLVDTTRDNQDLIRRAEGLERVFEAPRTETNTLGIAHEDGRRVNFRPEDLEHLSATTPNRPGPENIRVEGGKLFRWFAKPDGSLDRSELIRDFTEMRFETLRAPYDWRDEAPDDLDWHPLGEERS